MAGKKPINFLGYKGNFLYDVLNYVRLIIRLMGDGRVNPFLKLLPIGSLAFVLWPIDVPGPIDDAAVLGLGCYLFIELCPKEVVEEHIQQLKTSGQSMFWQKSHSSKEDDISAVDIIEAEFRDKNNEKGEE